MNLCNLKYWQTEKLRPYARSFIIKKMWLDQRKSEFSFAFTCIKKNMSTYISRCIRQKFRRFLIVRARHPAVSSVSWNPLDPWWSTETRVYVTRETLKRPGWCCVTFQRLFWKSVADRGTFPRGSKSWGRGWLLLIKTWFSNWLAGVRGAPTCVCACKKE